MEIGRIVRTTPKKVEPKIIEQIENNEEHTAEFLSEFELLTGRKYSAYEKSLEVLRDELVEKAYAEQRKLWHEAYVREQVMSVEERRKWLMAKHGYTEEEYWGYVAQCHEANPQNRPNERAERLEGTKSTNKKVLGKEIDIESLL